MANTYGNSRWPDNPLDAIARTAEGQSMKFGPDEFLLIKAAYPKRAKGKAYG